MILNVSNISKAYNDTPVLSGVSFHLEADDRAAVVGINGAGKTTLLNIITQALSPDDGACTFSKDISTGYLKQDATVDGRNTIYDELLGACSGLVSMENRLRDMEDKMSLLKGDELNAHIDAYEALRCEFELKGGLSYKSEITGILKGLGFDEEDFSRSIETLSGGQKTRVALSRLLISKPGLIILDEPTNHLDLKAVEFLENMLTNYRGAVLLVSHDRYFLDKVSNKIIELENTRVTVFNGNYSEYAVKKEALRIEKLNAYYKQAREIEHQEAVIAKLKQFNREKSIKRAESREKKLSKLRRIEKPPELNEAMNITLMPRLSSGKDVLSVKGISKGFGQNILFEDISFEIKRGEHVALIGDNGTGKSTMLKIINKLFEPDKGEICLGTNAEIAYFDQEHRILNDEKTLFDELSDEYRTLNNTEIRNALAAFLFTGDDVFKKIASLSGGEKGRLMLCKLMLKKANFLILDEPTNHLDITSKEILEDAINAFEGTVLYVSHDRYFINRTAERILELKDGLITEYLGDYDYYVEKSARNNAPDNAALNTGINQGALDYKAQREVAAAKKKHENELKKCEERIEFLENEIKKTDLEMSRSDIATNSVKLQELSKKQGEFNAELSELYDKWEALAE